MIRSARQGRQATKTTRVSHHNLSHRPTGLASSNSQSTKKTRAAKRADADEDGAQVYDYQANARTKGGRVSGNQVDDARLTAADSDAGEEDELSQIRRIVEGCEAEDEDGFGVVASDDDESIDSDEAMGEADDVRVKIVKSVAPNAKNKKTGRVRFLGTKDVDESEDSGSEGSEYTSSNASGFIDASTMLDIGAESDSSFPDADQSSASSDENDDDEIDLDESEGDQDEAKLDQLAHFVANTNSSFAQKRKEHLADGSNEQAKRRKLLAVQTEPRPEGEVVPSTSAAAGPQELSGAVNLEDLLENLSAKHDLSVLKKSLKPLAAASKSAAAGPLPAPLETRRQEQIEREAAYDLTKKEMSKWDETTRVARGLSGRATDGKERFVVSSDRLTTGEKDPDVMRWNNHFTPLNELECQVLGLVQTSDLSSKKLLKEEANLLEAKGLTPEQIRAKAADTKMARELMFRAERKAKRVAKIKSKTFRRIRKKERERQRAAGEDGPIDLDLMHQLDDIDGGSRVQSKHEKLELERARERVSLKHSSQGKWAKKVSGLKGLGSDVNAATVERIQREELLRKKIAGQAGSDGSEGQEDESDFDSDLDVDGIKEHALNQLSGLASRSEPASEQVAKGLMGMKFMQRAMATKARLADEAEAELRQQLADAEEYDSSAEKEENNSGGMRVQGNPGRLVFGPDTCRQVIDEEAGPNEPSPSNAAPPPSKAPQTTRTAGSCVRVLAPEASKPSSKAAQAKQSGVPAQGAVDSNPWLQATSGPGGTVSRLKDLIPSSKAKDSPTLVAEKSKLKAEKRKRKSVGEVAAAVEDGQVDIDMAVVLGSERGGGEALLEMEGKMGLAGEGDAVIRRGTTDGQGRSMAEQRELVSRAFADDGVVAQFAEEKKAQVELDAPKEVDVTIPGWGDWVGKGARKTRHMKKFTKSVPGVSPSMRQDAHLSHVIVSEKKHIKKLAKYQTKSLPYPYTSKSQLEHKMRVPIGPEFTTRKAHRQLVRPEVLGRPGVVVEPVSKPET